MAQDKDSEAQRPPKARVRPRKGRASPPPLPSQPRQGEERACLHAPQAPIIGVGASAGGIEALKDLLSGVPAEAGLALLVVQHLDPTHASQMATVLAGRTSLRVREAEAGMAVEPNTVYTIPAGSYLGLRDGRLQLTPQDPEQAPRMSVDFLFRSLAEELQERAIGVVLSGSGTDGTLGVRAVRGAGGLAVAQDPDTAAFDAMPRSAIATGLVDYVLPPAAIVPAVLNYIRHAYSKMAVEEDELKGPAADGLEEILRLLTRANADFRGYKPGTLLRRVHRRMGVNQIATLPEYAQLLRTRPDEVARLAKDMLISVTAFFRDPAAYEELRKLALAPLVKELPDDQPLRVWVAGCATGEEAYSIAILAQEELEAAGKTNALQIFASDLDEEALAVARAGVYPESIGADVSPERLARFFTGSDDSYRISRTIRDAVVFSAHNAVMDPPFTRMDLVSCRNVLIYLGADLQRRLVSLLTFAVRTGGYLFLSPAENLSGDTETFEPVSKRWRIFRRTPAPRHEMMDFPMGPKAPAPVAPPSQAKSPPANVVVLALRALLTHVAAALVLIDSKGNLLYSQGETEKYLRLGAGAPDLSLFSLAREKLARRLRAAVGRALATNEPVRLEHAPVRAEAGASVNVTVLPVGESSAPERVLAVVFEDVEETTAAQAAAPTLLEPDEASAALGQMEAELRETREELQLSAAEHAAATEEVRAAHEEAVSMNEELRSTNEELETSKEELQSVNEELNTLNSELRGRVEELNTANSDLANLFQATEIATVFLDRELRIRRFTPSATELLNLLPVDVGRPVSHISQRFQGHDLAADATRALRDLITVQQEIQTGEDARWYLMRLLPYRSVHDRIEGVVVTFVDITGLKRAEQESEEERIFAQSVVATVRGPLLVLDSDLRVVSANPSFYRTFQVAPEQTEGRLLMDLGNGQWNLPSLLHLLTQVIPEQSTVEDFGVEQSFPGLGRRSMLLNARRLERPGDWPPLLLLGMEDITDRKRAQLAEAMLAEISHRTKNNLAIVAGLLQMQADRRSPDEVNTALIRDAVTRIRAFAALHEQVQAGHSEQIEVVEALQRIAGIARTTLAVGDVDIQVDGEPVFCPFQDGTNLAVVANELITNALKHGAPDPLGVLRVKVNLGAAEGTLTLTVWNSGNPLPDRFDLSQLKEAGLFLVRSIVVDHYRGELRLEPYQGGTRAQVTLPESAVCSGGPGDGDGESGGGRR